MGKSPSRAALLVVNRLHPTCERCGGDGEDDRGDFCDPCGGTGTRLPFPIALASALDDFAAEAVRNERVRLLAKYRETNAATMLQDIVNRIEATS